jgi:hypothetical protein
MKFQRATEFTHVPPKPKVILPDDSYVVGEYAGSGSLKGKPVIVRDTRIFRQGIERGNRSENGPSVWMGCTDLKLQRSIIHNESFYG